MYIFLTEGHPPYTYTHTRSQLVAGLMSLNQNIQLVTWGRRRSGCGECVCACVLVCVCEGGGGGGRVCTWCFSVDVRSPRRSVTGGEEEADWLHLDQICTLHETSQLQSADRNTLGVKPVTSRYRLWWPLTSDSYGSSSSLHVTAATVLCWCRWCYFQIFTESSFWVNCS